MQSSPEEADADKSLWFDHQNRIEWLWLIFGLTVVLGSFVGIAMLPDVHKKSLVLKVIEATPANDRIRLGDPYVIRILVDKIRDDCENGRILRHMVEINNGWFYITEEIESLQLPVGVRPLNLVMSTTPRDPTMRELMIPGVWEIVTKVTYDCPDGEGGEKVERDYKFKTPTFTVLER